MAGTPQFPNGQQPQQPPANSLPVTPEGDDGFMIGMDSYTQPSKLMPGEYQLAMNTVNRGGVIQTRPGSRSLFNMPPGRLQGCTFFSPANGSSYLVFAVDGLVYASQNPFRTYYQIPNIQFNKNSKYISWAVCQQSTDYDTTGTLYALPTPTNILMIQDGNTRAAYWAPSGLQGTSGNGLGSTSGHINPTPTPAIPIVRNIMNASNATPIVITTTKPLTTIATGEYVTIQGVAGNTNANGVWTVTAVDSTHFILNGSSGNAAFILEPSTAVALISGASSTTPIVVTTQTAAPIQSGQEVIIKNVGGNTTANGTWTVQTIDDTDFVLIGSAYNDHYTTGGDLTYYPSATLTTNPTADGAVATLPGFDGTAIGLWMVWSNNRLWVSNGNTIYASDLGNPLKFTEDQYLINARSFSLPGPCTGAKETPDRTGVIFFTRDVGYLLLSSIETRSLWESTAGFMSPIFPNTGCIAPRSIIAQYGLLWWFTPKGLISQNSALNLNITSYIWVQDNEMVQSKANLSFDLSMVCGGFIENYTFHALPSGSNLNTRLHVLDQAPFEGKIDFWRLNSWPSYWKGWRPVEFATGITDSSQRVFCCSYDYDGVNRMWELFQNEKTDNGCPITSYVLTKTHYWGNRDWKRFKYVEAELHAIQGPTAFMGAIAGIRGAFVPVLEKDINAEIGQVYNYGLYGFDANNIASTSAQTRVVRSVDMPATSPANAAAVEDTTQRGLVDKGFNALFVWSGIAGISSYRIFSQPEPYPLLGTVEKDETDTIHLLNSEGFGSITSEFLTNSPFTTYYAESTFSKINPSTGYLITNTSTQDSIINQEDANRKSSLMAQWYVLSTIGEIV